MLKKSFLIFLVTLSVFAKLERVQEEGVSIKRFGFKEVCSSFGVKDPLIVEKKDPKTIDCMGKEFPIAKFCLNKYELVHNYTKARFDSVEKKVNCHFAETVILSVECDKKHGHYCKSPDKGCKKLKPNFAFGLDFSKSLLLEKFPMILKCFYSSKSPLSL
jgi:hypothetical protein